MSKPSHLLIIAGDPSADRHGAALVAALKRRRPEIRVSSLGGPQLRSASDAFLYPLVEVGGFGFWEPLLKLPELWKAYREVKKLIMLDRPDLVIPMDYYGFNIKMARLAHGRGIPVAYYISPQVWASRAGRIQKLAAVVDRMLVIFPFELALYKKAGVPATFVGHPLLERMPEPGSPARTPTIGILPGSRPGTIRRHLPVLVETAKRLHAHFPELRCVLFRPDEMSQEFYASLVRLEPWIEISTDPLYDTRKSLWLAIGVSGTAALENMLLGIPMIIMYKLSTLTYWIARSLIQVPFVGIPNLLAGKSVVPERIQAAATPEQLFEDALPLLSDARQRESVRHTLLSLRATLQEGGSSRAADVILEMIA